MSRPHAVERLVGRRAHGHVAGDDRDLGLEVDAPVLAQEVRRLHRPRKSSLPPWYMSGSS
jgi:hypothetical protein